MSHHFTSDGFELVGQLARPERIPAGGVPALVICHGFPTPSNGRLDAARSYYDLADRVADDLGWLALAFTFRGCGESEGDFSLGGWRRDVDHAVAHLRSMPEVSAVWVAGFGTGGSLGIVAAAADPTISGVAAIAPPADFDDWKRDPEGLLAYAREVGAIKDPSFPSDMEEWTAELAEIRAVAADAHVAPRPLLVMHGALDDVVPVFDARVIADSHGSADLRIIEGAGHRLRFDPRAVAVFLGWLERANRTPGTSAPGAASPVAGL